MARADKLTASALGLFESARAKLEKANDLHARERTQHFQSADAHRVAQKESIDAAVECGTKIERNMRVIAKLADFTA